MQPAAAVPGELLAYTIVVTNNGPDSAQDVILYDEIPPELTSVQFSLDEGVNWYMWVNPLALGQLEAGQAVVSDFLPSELCNPAYSLDNGRTWHAWAGSLHLGGLAAGGSICILVSGIVSRCAKGFIENTAAVSSQTPDPYPSNNMASVTVSVYSGCLYCK